MEIAFFSSFSGKGGIEDEEDKDEEDKVDSNCEHVSVENKNQGQQCLGGSLFLFLSFFFPSVFSSIQSFSSRLPT